MLNLFVAWINIDQPPQCKYKFCFARNCQASASSKMFNGSRVFAHSLVIEYKRESESSAFGRFLGITTSRNPHGHERALKEEEEKK